MTTLQWVFALALIPGSIISLILVMIIFPESVMEKLSPLGHIGFTILAGPIWWIMLTFATVYVVLKTLYRTFKTSKGLSIMDRLLASCREAAAVLFLSERAQRNRASLVAVLFADLPHLQRLQHHSNVRKISISQETLKSINR
jgi:hypothetical protein